jgi:hypothetical protein
MNQTEAMMVMRVGLGRSMGDERRGYNLNGLDGLKIKYTWIVQARHDYLYS